MLPIKTGTSIPPSFFTPCHRQKSVYDAFHNPCGVSPHAALRRNGDAGAPPSRTALVLYITRTKNLHTTVRFFASTARDQIVTRRHLVLQTPNVSVGRSKLGRRQPLIQDLMNGVLGL